MNKKVMMTGISRISPSNLSDDGLCRDIVGARLYNGAMRPIGGHPLFQSSGVIADSRMHIHTITNGDQYIIAYDSSTGVVSYCKVGSAVVSTLTTLSLSKTIRFASLKNVLLIINDTDQTMAYAVFSTTTNAYSYIGTERFPNIINISFSQAVDPAKVVDSEGESILESDYDYAWADQQINSMLLVTETGKNKTGTFTGGVSLVFAYELFDGTIVKHSQPCYLSAGSWQFYANLYVDGDPKIQITTKYHHYDVSYTINTLDSVLNTLRSTYSGVIKSVNLYMSRPVNTYNSGIEASGKTGVDQWYSVDRESEASVQGKVIELPYYLIKKISLDKLAYNATGLIFNGDIGSIATLSPLPTDNFSHHKLYAGCDFLYNSRLFLGNCRTTLYRGFNAVNFIKQSPTFDHSGTNYQVYLETEIKDGSDIKVVTSLATNYSDYDSSNKITFSLETFLAYPDSRASTIRVMVRTSGALFWKAAEYTLSNHPFHNFAYYITDDSNNMQQDNFVAQTLMGVNDIVIDNNRIQATRVDNAFVHPAENSYNVGHASIVGLGANTLLVDTGQFGEYPVYAFTQSGVWALAISSDPEILIDRIVPSTRDVCISRDSIVPTEYGVVFLSSDGVMLLSGMKSEKISRSLEGDYVSILDNNPDFGFIRASALMADVSGNAEDCTFNSFLSGAVMGYNHIKKELIISNPDKVYSYLFSFQSKAWYRSNAQYNRFISHFPRYLGERAGVLYDITVDDFSVNSHTPVFIETSHIKLEVDSFKKIQAMAARGTFKNSTGTSTGCYLFGSVDGYSWHMISGNEKSQGIQDLILPRSSYSVISLIVVFAGTLSEDSFLTHLDFEFIDRFKARMR